MKKATIFLDIDGTIFKHKESLKNMLMSEPEILEGTLDKLYEWHNKGYMIILTTARPEGSRYKTEKQLNKLGVVYSKLIMNLSSGPRIVINDTKPDGTVTAIAKPLIRDAGIKNIEL